MLNNNLIGFVGLLTIVFITLLSIVFITLKLTGFINWSGIWVLSPIWITAIFVVILLIIAGIILVIKTNKLNYDPKSNKTD